MNKGCVTHTVALPFTLKRSLKQKKNYGNSNISPCKNIKSFQRNPNPSRYYYNSIINQSQVLTQAKYIIFQNPYVNPLSLLYAL